MAGLGGNFAWTLTCLHRPSCALFRKPPQKTLNNQAWWVQYHWLALHVHCFFFCLHCVCPFSDKVKVANLTLQMDETDPRKLVGNIVFEGNLQERVYVKVLKGVPKRSGRVVRKENFIPSQSPNPFQLSGVLTDEDTQLQMNEAYTLKISSHRGGFLMEKAFTVTRKCIFHCNQFCFSAKANNCTK